MRITNAPVFKLFIIVVLYCIHIQILAQNTDTQLVLKADSISKLLAEIYNQNDWNKIGGKEVEFAKDYQSQGLLSHAIEHYQAAEKAYRKSENQKALLSIYSELGKLYNELHYGENGKALHNFLKAYELADSLGDDEVAYIMLGNIGSIYSLERRYDEGLKYLFMAIDRLKKLKLKKNISTFYGNIANVYIEKNNYDSAYYYYDVSNRICLDEHDTITLGRNYVNMANLSIRTKQYDKAINYLHKCLDIYIPRNNAFGIAITYKLLAKAYFLKKDYSKAENYARKSLEIGKQIGSSNRVMSAYKILWKINEEKENYKEALKYLSLYKALSDSVKQQKEEDEIARLISGFENQQNLREIKLLRVENALSESRLKNKSTQLYFIIIIAIILLISAGIFIWLYLKKKKAYLEILRKNIELEKRESGQDLEQNTENKHSDVDMKLIEAWKQKVVNTGLFKNPDCSIDLCAQHIGTNRSYLSRAINHYYGKNYTSVINELRIREARKLLSRKDAKKYTIDFIAQQVGFNNKVSFTSYFKKITGLTPAFYRDNIQSIDN